MLNRDGCLKFFSLPVGIDVSFDRIAYQFGDAAIGWVVRLMSCCASMQSRNPLYYIEVTSQSDIDYLTQRCRIDSPETCKSLIEYLVNDGLCAISDIEGRRYFTFLSIIDDAARLVQAAEKRRRRATKAAEARWKKDNQERRDRQESCDCGNDQLIQDNYSSMYI